MAGDMWENSENLTWKVRLVKITANVLYCMRLI